MMLHFDITCARCKRLVDGKMIEADSDSRLTRLTVWCHGATDTCEVDLRRVDPANIIEIVAFRTEALPAAGEKRHMIQFREHRGPLSESIATLRTFTDWMELLSHVRTIQGVGANVEMDDLRFSPCGADDRIGWQNTYLVTSRSGVVGYTDAAPERSQFMTKPEHWTIWTAALKRRIGAPGRSVTVDAAQVRNVLPHYWSEEAGTPAEWFTNYCRAVDLTATQDLASGNWTVEWPATAPQLSD